METRCIYRKTTSDIVNNINGTVYRTYTPIYHVWYQSIKNPRSNMWIDFQKDFHKILLIFYEKT